MVDPDEALQMDAEHIRQLRYQLFVRCTHPFSSLLVVLYLSLLKIAVKATLQIVTSTWNFQIKYIKWLVLHINSVIRNYCKFSFKNTTKYISYNRFLHYFRLIILDISFLYLHAINFFPFTTFIFLCLLIYIKMFEFLMTLVQKQTQKILSILLLIIRIIRL